MNQGLYVLLGVLIGFILGFIAALVGQLSVEREAVKKKIVRLDGRLYRIEDIGEK